MGRFSISENKLYNRAKNWITVLSDESLRVIFGWSVADCEAVIAVCKAFIALYEAKSDAKGIAFTHTKNDAKAALKKHLYHFSGANIRYNEKVPSEVRLQLGLLSSDDEKPTVVPFDKGPDSYTIIDTLVPGVIVIRYRGRKPGDRCYCRIRWTFDPPVEDNAQSMSNFTEESFGHNPWKHLFPGKRGHILYFSLRWEMLNGKVGQWSPIKSCVVP